MSANLEVRELTDGEFADWNRMVAASPDGSPYAMPEYLDALCTAAGGDFSLLGAFRAEELVGGVPLYRRSGVAGRFISPRLLLYYLSPVVRPSPSTYPSQRTAKQIEALGALADAIASRGFDHTTLKCRHSLSDVRPFLARGWAAWPSYSYVVPLGDLSAAWSRVEQNLRRLVARPPQHGVGFVEDDDFSSFYALHRRTLDRKDAATYLPETAFQDFFSRLRGQGLCRLYHARLPDGRSIASQLVLTGSHPLSHTVSAAADPDHLSLGVNAFLRWKSFEALAALGYAANDLTDAALNPVTHFKSQLGGELVTCLVLRSPESLRWRAVTAAGATMGRVGSTAGALIRRLKGRP